MNVSKVIDGLVRLGAEVVHSGIEDVHASGHAKQEELKTLLSIVQPEYFVPVHGEYRHMVAHAKLAKAMGVCPTSTCSCATDGDQLVLDDDGLRVDAGTCPPATSTSTASSATSATACCATAGCWPRRAWSSSWSPSTSPTGAILTGPEVITRGWVYAPEAEPLLAECADEVRRAVKEAFAEGATDIEALQRVVRRAAGRFVNERPSAAR